MFEFLKFGEGIQGTQILWIIIGLLVLVQVISLINQSSLARKNRRCRRQIQEMKRHIYFLSIQPPGKDKVGA